MLWKKEIHYNGKLFATFKFDAEGFPEFEFVPLGPHDIGPRMHGAAEWYNHKRTQAIETWKKYYKPGKLTLSQKIADAVVQELTVVMLPHLKDMLSWEEKVKLNEQFKNVIDRVTFRDKLDKEIGID
jgi:hypothetical protein